MIDILFLIFQKIFFLLLLTFVFAKRKDGIRFFGVNSQWLNSIYRHQWLPITAAYVCNNTIELAQALMRVFKLCYCHTIVSFIVRPGNDTARYIVVRTMFNSIVFYQRHSNKIRLHEKLIATYSFTDSTFSVYSGRIFQKIERPKP